MSVTLYKDLRYFKKLQKSCLQFFTEPSQWFGLFIEYAMVIFLIIEHFAHDVWFK